LFKALNTAAGAKLGDLGGKLIEKAASGLASHTLSTVASGDMDPSKFLSGAVMGIGTGAVGVLGDAGMGGLFDKATIGGNLGSGLTKTMLEQTFKGIVDPSGTSALGVGNALLGSTLGVFSADAQQARADAAEKQRAEAEAAKPKEEAPPIKPDPI